MKIRLLFFFFFIRTLISLEIEGIILTSPQEIIQPVRGIHFQGISPPSEQKFKERLEPLLHSPLDLAFLEHLKREITEFYVECDRPFIAVCIPEQKIDQETLRVDIIEPQIDKIHYTGNFWIPTKQLSTALKFSPGDPLQETLFTQRLSSINRNPFLNASAVISPGQTSGTSSVTIVSKDRFPLRPYSGIDNTGTEATDIYRCFFGVNWTPHLSSLLSYQYTASLDFHKFWSHFGSWTLYLPNSHELLFFGTFAKIRPEIDHFRSIGRSTQLSGRYSFFYRPLSDPSRKAFYFGYDYKQFNSALFFIEFEGEELSSPISSKNASISQFLLGYDSATSPSKNQFTFNVEVVFSPASLLPNQTRTNYDLLRSGAKPRYIYGKLHLNGSYQLPWYFSLNGILQAQGTGSILLPSEQLGIGGHNTVRGYEEREYLADNGLCSTLEMRLSFNPKKDRDLIFLTFTDYGYGSTLRQLFSEDRSQSFWSIGGGMRYAFLPHFTARADYGYRLITTDQSKAFGGRFHFSVIGSF